jgi:hypothetical protein
MYSDISGYISESLKNGLIAIGIAVLVVAVIAVVTVASGGLATPVLVGAALGAFTGGTISAGMQYATTGSVDIGQVMLSASVGAIMGGFSGSALSQVGMTIAGATTGFGSSVGSDLISGDSIHWGRAVFSSVASGFFTYMGGAGGQYNTIGNRALLFDKQAALSSRFLGQENSLAYKSALESVTRRLGKATVQSYNAGFDGVYYGIYPAILNGILNH